MKAMFTAFSRSPKLAALFAVLVGVLVVPAALLAWGPSRTTFTIDKPADYVTFNSITNNPNIGDERNFVGIREYGTNNLWSDNMNVQPGKSYTVRMYVHNNAADNLNLVARDVTAMFNLPTNTAKSIQVNGFLSSSNASPKEVYDHATFTSDQDFNLAYKAGTLKFENNFFGATGTPISESVFTSSGAKLGYDKLDGNIPGCFKYAGYLSFVVTPQFAPSVSNFDVTKQVRKSGETNWKESVDVKAGDTVEYQLSYKNTGNTRVNNVVFQDKLPAGLQYVGGSTMLKNGTNPNGLKISDNLTTANGVNVGDYNPAATAYVKFSAKVNDTSALKCGTNTLTNTVRVVANNGYKEDTANVVINKPCAPGELPQTGPAESIFTITGIGALAAGTMYAFRSARVRNWLRG